MGPVDTSSLAFLEGKAFRVESVFDTVPVGLCVLDLSFRYVLVNECFAEMYGMTKADFIGRTVQEALPGPASQIMQNLREALAADGPVELEIALQNPRKNRVANAPEEMIYLRTAQPLRDERGVACGISVALLDITARKQAERSFHAAEEDLHYTKELSPHLPWTTDGQGELTFMSPRWNTITGRTGDVYLKEWADVLHPDDLGETMKRWTHSVATGEPYDSEYRIRYSDGGWRWVRARAYPRRIESGEIVRWYGTVEDIHDRKIIAMQLEEATQELDRRAREDYLTGLANRRHFDGALTNEIERARRAKVMVALILLDVDHFKNYNDIAGHLAGDECLQEVARTIQKTIRRPADLAARFGGEEFVVLLPDTSLAGAIEIANRILAGVRKLTFSHEDPKVQQVTISAGVAVLAAVEYPITERAVTSLIEAADRALYTAKANGRDRVASQS